MKTTYVAVFAALLVTFYSDHSWAEYSYSNDASHSDSNVTNTKDHSGDISHLNLLTKDIQLPKYEGWTESEVLQATANYFFNQQSQHSEICKVNMSLLKDGSLPVGSFTGANSGRSIPFTSCFDLDLFKVYDNYPYACNSDYSKKNMRLDWLVYKLLIQANYHKADNVPKTLTDILNETGVDIKFGNPQVKPIVTDQSLVARDLRAIAVGKNDKGEAKVILTYDYNREVKKQAGGSLALNPVGAQFDAAEIFIIKPNNLWKYVVYDIKGNKNLESAPGGVADFGAAISSSPVADSSPSVLAHKDFVSVRNGQDCMICHSQGPISLGVNSINKQIIKEAQALGVFKDGEYAGKESFVRNFYSIPSGKENDPDYDETLKHQQDLKSLGDKFQNALTQMGVKKEIMIRPILPDVSALYSAPLTLDLIAKELDVTKDELKTVIKVNEKLKNLLGVRGNPDNLLLDRALFEERYCLILSTLKGIPLIAKEKSEHIAAPVAKPIYASEERGIPVIPPKTKKTTDEQKEQPGIVMPNGLIKRVSKVGFTYYTDEKGTLILGDRVDEAEGRPIGSSAPPSSRYGLGTGRSIYNDSQYDSLYQRHYRNPPTRSYNTYPY